MKKIILIMAFLTALISASASTPTINSRGDCDSVASLSMIPDLVPTTELIGGNAYVGQTVDWHIRVYNNNNNQIGDFDTLFVLEGYTSQTLPFTNPFTLDRSLLLDETIQYTYTYVAEECEWDEGIPGEYDVYLCIESTKADSGEEICEYNENNNLEIVQYDLFQFYSNGKKTMNPTKEQIKFMKERTKELQGKTKKTGSTKTTTKTVKSKLTSRTRGKSKKAMLNLLLRK